jgi:PKD repeat protein
VTLTASNGYGSDTVTKPGYITVTPNEIYVYNIIQVISKKGKNCKSTAWVTIRDRNNDPVENAAVYITWSDVVSGSASGITGADGTVTFESARVKSTGPFTITVDNVTHDYIYNPALNNETSDSASF